MTSASRLKVGLIGAGRAGCAVGAALNKVGHQVVAAAAISDASQQRVAERLPGTTILPTPEVVATADLLILAVPDDVLAELVSGIAAADGFPAGQLVAHLSGAHGIAVLNPATRQRVIPLALHPVMTFTGREEDAMRMLDISWGVTAPEAARPIAEALVVEVGGNPVWISEEHRPLYHAALAVGANFLVTLIAEAASLLRKAGVARPDLMLAPLVGAALDNALRLGDAGLTGPVARGDAATVAGHIAALRHTQPQTADAYVALARRTADRALAAGRLSPGDAEPLLRVLAEDRSAS